MADLKLKAQKREIFGRKVKKLRAEGLIPAHVFGHHVKTIHVSVPAKDFTHVWRETGETTILDLGIDGEKRPVLVRGVQTHPVSDKILHIDFYQVSLKEKVKVMVPIHLVGESPAAEKNLGVLLHELSEVEIEALPQDLPESIEADVSGLANVDDAIHVADLKVSKEKVTIHADPGLVVVHIGELVTKEAEEVLAEAEAEREAVVEEAAEEKVGEAVEEVPAEEAAEEKAEEAPKED